MLVEKLVIIEITHNMAEKVASIFFSIITRITVRMKNKIKQMKDVVPIISKSFGVVDKESIRLLNNMVFPFGVVFSLQKCFVLLY
jgi:hypothetical protein